MYTHRYRYPGRTAVILLQSNTGTSTGTAGTIAGTTSTRWNKPLGRLSARPWLCGESQPPAGRVAVLMKSPAQQVVGLLLAFQPAAAWITLSQSRFGAQLNHIQAQMQGNYSAGVPIMQLLGFIWNMPSDPASTAGLGGGITWAWDEHLCRRLLPRFHEDLLFIEFITCDVLKAAMRRGFASWADNHARYAHGDQSGDHQPWPQLPN